MPNGTTSPPGCPNPEDPNSGPSCPGAGTEPYVTSVSNPLNYGAKVEYDSVKNMYYFTAIVIEWFDR